MAMHTTTVRFAGTTWRELKAACERDGIATAQYIREATVGRLAMDVQTATCVELAGELALLDVRVARVERLLAVRGLRLE